MSQYTHEDYIQKVLDTSKQLLLNVRNPTHDEIRMFCAKKYHEAEELSANPQMVLNYSRSVEGMSEQWNTMVIDTIHGLVDSDSFELETYGQIQQTAALIAFGLDVVWCAAEFVEGLMAMDESIESLNPIATVCDWLGGGEA